MRNYRSSCEIHYPFMIPLSNTDKELDLSMYLLRKSRAVVMLETPSEWEKGQPRVSALKYETISSDSSIFYIQFKRNIPDSPKKIPTVVRFPTDIDIASKHFTLQAAIYHCGEDVSSGHYVAVVHSKSEWLLCNDESITSLTSEFPEQTSIQTVYMLFYIHTNS